jgi:hypothetical protein
MDEQGERFDDEEPELVGYVPIERTSLQRRRRQKAMRILVLVAVAALVIPGVLSTISLAHYTAEHTCAVYVQRYQPRAVGSATHFDVFGPRGPGWDCYSVDSAGNETFLVLLGFIPSAPLPPSELTNDS